MLENKISFKGSTCFEPEEARGEIPVPRPVHNFQECQKEGILFSQAPLLNIPKLILTRIRSGTPSNSISIPSKIPYKNSDKAILFSRNQVFCLKILKLLRAATTL